jgi:hypothetical protein
VLRLNAGMLPPGVKFDLFRGTAPARIVEAETFFTDMDKEIKVPSSFLFW